MITKRDLIIVLAAFCLTFTLFTVLPAGSNYKTSGTGEYDPWADFNDDGRINILDAINLGNSFGTTGDPTKNVNVTNLPLDTEGNIKVSEQTSVQTYKDAVEIVVFDSPLRMGNGVDYATPGYEFGFYFAFSPKQTFLEVTRFSVQVMGTKDGSVGWQEYWFNVTMNNQLVYTETLQVLEYNIGQRTGLIIDPAKCSLIIPGINSITVAFANFVDLIFLYRVRVIIEYEYQA